MKITAQLLRTRAGGALHTCQYVDLSALGIEVIEKLSLCPQLKTLSLRQNAVEYIDNLESCPQLWNLDLANNRVKILTGLQRFVAIGTLVLSNNDIAWAELAKIRHLHILDLSLHGNPQLEKDPYYRIHIIDSLPNVWMLDGRIVTSAERMQVKQFYEDSALTEHPVRHKLSKAQFTPSCLKQVQVNGVFGERADHLMRRFPVNGSLNVDTDRRRLRYLAYSLQEDLYVEAKAQKRSFSLAIKNRKFLEVMLDIRDQDRVKCNMILLLLVASLEFAMPINLMNECLSCTKLSSLGEVTSMEMFLLPRAARCHIVALLLSAVKVDKDIGEEGGLYDKLYLCLYYSVSELMRIAQGARNDKNTNNQFSFYAQSKCLIATEVVQLFCIVPTFFEYVTKDDGVKNLVSVATNDHMMVEKIAKYIKRLENAGVEKQNIFEQIAEMILTAIQKNTLNTINKTSAKRRTKKSQEDYILQTSHAIPYRAQSACMFSAEYQARGIPTPARSAVRLKSGKHERERYIPKAKLGDHVLLGPQNLGRVISVPEPNLILVQMDVIPAETGAMVNNTKNCEEHYTYIDVRHLQMDEKAGFWRPVGTVGDRISIHKGEELVGDKSIDRGSFISPPATPHSQSAVSRRPTSLLRGLDKLRGVTPQTPRPKSSCEKDLPQPVSEMLKQKLNLRLEVDRSGSQLPSSSPSDRSQPGGRLSAESVKFKDPLSENDDKIHCTTPADSIPEGATPSGLYNSVKDAINIVQSIAQTTPRGILIQHDKKLASKTRSRKTVTMVNEKRVLPQITTIRKSGKPADISPRGSDDEDDELLFQNEVVAMETGSRRSSLASEDEPELKQLVGDSRPSTGGLKTAYSDRATLGTPETIAIPQMVPDDMEASSTQLQVASLAGELSVVREVDKGSSSRSDTGKEEKSPLSSRSRRGVSKGTKSPIPTQSMTFPESGLGSRPTSATQGDQYKMVVSTYQQQRTDAWKLSVDKSPVVSEAQPAMPPPPPQRPPSPLNMDRQRAESAKSGGFSVLRTDRWLGGGRDLHWEKLQSRPKSSHTPGWMEGLPQRPKSAAALRAMKRARTPNVATPSSVAYDSALGRGSQSPELLYALDHRPVSASAAQTRPRPRSGDLIHLHSSILRSHPKAKEAYAFKQLSRKLCGECQAQRMNELDSLRNLLGPGCEDILGTLGDLQQCEHIAGGSGGLPELENRAR